VNDDDEQTKTNNHALTSMAMEIIIVAMNIYFLKNQKFYYNTFSLNAHSNKNILEKSTILLKTSFYKPFLTWKGILWKVSWHAFVCNSLCSTPNNNGTPRK
jgi:hypothetical protein